jgi:hypothetical protein
LGTPAATLKFLELTFFESPVNVKLTALPVDMAPGRAQDLTDPAACEHGERNAHDTISPSPWL